MTSEIAASPEQAYVWIWLPGANDPVVAGRVETKGELVSFNYGRSYLERPEAIPLYLPELPLLPGRIDPLDGMRMAGSIDDALPDAWGRRVIMRHTLDRGADSADTAVLGPPSYMLGSDSDRVGALDFQPSAESYEPRHPSQASLEDLMRAADTIDQGLPLPRGLDQALLHGSRSAERGRRR